MLEYLTSALTSPWVILIILICISSYTYVTWNFKKYESMGVPYITPTPFFGNIKERLLLQVSFPEMQGTLYKRLNGHNIGGFFEGRRPILMIRDPELLRIIMVRDFECFVDRFTTSLRPHDPSEQMLLVLKGTPWKNIRTLSTPIFTSGKMKLMSHLIVECTQQMITYLDKYHGSNEIEMKEFFGRFTLDTIASCAFGIQCDSLSNPEGEFVSIMTKFNDRSFKDAMALFVSLILVGSPKLARFLGVRFINRQTQDYLTRVVLQMKEQREKEAEEAKQNGVSHKKRMDFLQLMLDARSGQLLSDQKDDSDLFSKDAHLKHTTISKQSPASYLTDDILIGQSFLFLLAGFETSSTLLTFACYELAQHPEVQAKLRDEVREAIAKHEGKLCYEALADMPYLENVLNETLRKHPPVARVDRLCTTDHYQVPGTKAILKRGDVVTIPIRGLHHDPMYYPNPEKFDPDRFLPENKQNRSPYVFLPFGSGPRNCIGMRFAMMSSKMAMASLVNVFNFEPCGRTEIPYKVSKTSPFLKAANGIYLKLNKCPN